MLILLGYTIGLVIGAVFFIPYCILRVVLDLAGWK